MKKLIYILLMPALLFSCVKDEADIFDKSASERMSEAIENTMKILTSSEYGWFGDYYPEANHSKGGYAMFLKFYADGTVDVMCEIATNVPERQTETSSFGMTADQGPVLSFNTYNKVMHYFSEPLSSSQASGRAGDYEFIIMSATPDKVVLKGKKRGNKMTLRRNVNNIDPETYLTECTAAAAAAAYSSFKFVVNDIERGEAVVSDRTYTPLTYHGSSSGETTISYAYTPDGIRLYEPFVFEGITMERFVWNPANRRHECVEPAGVNAYFEAIGLSYLDFLGTYTMSYSTSNAIPINRNRTATVTFEPAIAGQTYYIKGILTTADEALGNIVARYSGRYGIELLGQIIFVRAGTNYDFWWLPYSDPTDGNYVYLSTTTGMNASDLTYTSGDDISFTMIDNGVWSRGTAGFLLRNYNGSTSAGNVNGADGQAFVFYPMFTKQ
ncbi:MAG: DUF4302 domain-containing protein [Bacteroidales bacterium]|nr:DUF4302 domain-containing protein [Bacteroidales bacterium]MCL2132941.1 DUF4302 domain-containing protein [Bacteroidales bacterium]